MLYIGRCLFIFVPYLILSLQKLNAIFTMSYTIKISHFLADIADAFMGNYNHKNEDLDAMRDEVFDISIIPNSGDDKKALKKDFDNFLKDTKKAHESLKEEVENG